MSMEKINILYVVASMKLGGAERMAANLALGLNKSKYKVTFCAFEPGPLSKELSESGIEVFIFRRKMRYDIFLLWKVLMLMIRKKIMIVHAHAFQQNCYAFPAAKITGVPLFVMSEHGSIEKQLAKKRRFYINKVFMNSADAFITVSNAHKNELVEFLKAPREKITVVYNGVDITKSTGIKSTETIKKGLNIDLNTYLVTNVGNFRPVKNQGYFLQAAVQVLKKLPRTIFLLVGEGGMRSELEDLSKKLGIAERVMFLGSREDVADILSITDVAAVSSSYETFGIAAAEAMAMSKPVVATAVGGIPELVKDKVSGFLVPLENPEKMAGRIVQLLEDKNLAESMGKAGRACIEKNFTLKLMIDNIDQLYQRLMAKKGINRHS